MAPRGLEVLACSCHEGESNRSNSLETVSVGNIESSSRMFMLSICSVLMKGEPQRMASRLETQIKSLSSFCCVVWSGDL